MLKDNNCKTKGVSFVITCSLSCQQVGETNAAKVEYH